MLIEDVIKPADCAIAFSIPLSKEDFFNDLSSPHKTFVKTHCPAFAKYRAEIIDLFETKRPSLEHSGVRVFTRVSFEDYSSLLKEGYKLIILVAHCEQGGDIEFFDKLVSPNDIVDRIPNNYNGVLDLSACGPIELAEQADLTRPGCFIRFSTIPISIGSWLIYHDVFFKYIAFNGLSYINAYRDITLEFLKNKNE